MLSITNSKYLHKNSFEPGKNIIIENSIITDIADQPQHNIINANGNYLIPGFVDLQIYGAAGELFSANPSIEALTIIEKDLLKKGTTAFLICLATNTPQLFNTSIEVVKNHRQQAKNCLGLHLEGPFLNVKKSGAHVKEYIRKATLDEVKELLDLGDGCIKMITIAPETQDDAVVQYFLDNNVIVSLGHSDATFEQATAAYNKGVQTTTHLFNAMSPIHHREPGIPTAVFNHSKAMASIIPDGLHVDFEVVKMAQRLLQERLFIITDAVTECNEGPYQHKLSGNKFVLPDGTLSGSNLIMIEAIKNCVSHCNINLADAVKMATEYPAKLIKQKNVFGKIDIGQQASLLLIDENLNLQKVIFKGQEI